MVNWHKEPTPDGTPKWYADLHGERVAEAAKTGRDGVDWYPWDWSLTDAGLALLPDDGARRKTVGVADTLRSIKESVAGLVA
jgi:hypothetical protein